MHDATSAAIPILQEESHFLLVSKPAGLFTQAAAGIDSLAVRLAAQLKQRDAHPGQPFIGLPHRLDRGTSGAVLIARNQRALKRFGQQFQSRKVGKFYLALSEGLAPDGLLEWEDYLRKIPDEPRAERVTSTDAGGRHARATALCLERTGDLSLLLVRLETGRMHQVRIQAACRGLPLVGDIDYGAVRSFPSLAAEGMAVRTSSEVGTGNPVPSGATRPLGLHALRLEFRHPQTARQLSGTAPVPANWRDLPVPLVQRIDQWIASSSQQPNQAWHLTSAGLQIAKPE